MPFSAAHTAGTICRHSVSDNTSSPCQGKGCRRKQVHGGTSVGAMPCCVREFIGDSRFRRCSPANGFKGDFHEPRISNVPAGTISARPPDSPQTPTPDTGEQAQTGKSRQFFLITHTPPPGSRPPLPPPTLTVTSASANASADTDNHLNVGRRF